MASERLDLLVRLFPDLEPDAIAATVDGAPEATFDDLVGMLREQVPAIPGTHYIRNPETGEIDIHDNPPARLAPFIIPPEQLPGVLRAPSSQEAPGPQIYLGRRGLYEATTPIDPANDYRIVSDWASADAVMQAGELPLIVPPEVMDQDPTMDELEDYRRAQYETPDSPFGTFARQRAGLAGAPPPIDPRYDDSHRPMRSWPRHESTPDWSFALGTFRQEIKEFEEEHTKTIRDYDAILRDLEASPPPETNGSERPGVFREGLSPSRGDRESLADLIPRAEPPALLPPSDPATPSLASSLPAPPPPPRARVVPLADYLQQRLMQVGGER